MKVQASPLKDCYIIEPTIFEDNRGYFYESFNEKTFHQLTDLSLHFVQDNQAKSNYGIVRGLHWQGGEHAQAKLVRVLKGKVLDVVVDLRKNSPTFLQSFSIELSEDNKLQLFVPRGFAHGYSVLEDDTIFFYKCDNFYCKVAEKGLNYADTHFNINWRVPVEAMILSDKDLILPHLNEIQNEDIDF